MIHWCKAVPKNLSFTQHISGKVNDTDISPSLVTRSFFEIFKVVTSIDSKANVQVSSRKRGLKVIQSGNITKMHLHNSIHGDMVLHCAGPHSGTQPQSEINNMRPQGTISRIFNYRDALVTSPFPKWRPGREIAGEKLTMSNDKSKPRNFHQTEMPGFLIRTVLECRTQNNETLKDATNL